MGSSSPSHQFFFLNRKVTVGWASSPVDIYHIFHNRKELLGSLLPIGSRCIFNT